MKVAIVGRESVDELEAWVRELFAAVPTNGAKPPTWEGIEAVNSAALPMRVHTVPVKDVRSLGLSWSIPPLDATYRVKQGNYLSHLIGHEGPGSILSLLKARGWADELGAGAAPIGPEFGAFSIDIDLTADGLEHVDEVCNIVFAYINMLRADGHAGIQEWIYHECRVLAENQFLFKGRENAIQYATSITDHMQRFQTEDVLTGSRFFCDFDRDVIRKTFDALTADTVIVHVAAKTFAGRTDKVEKWYGTEYATEPVAADTIKRWSEVRLPATDLNLPAPNRFIATNFHLAPQPENAPDVPVVLRRSPFETVWHKQDNTFRKPKLHVRMNLTSPEAYHSPRHAILARLVCRLVNDALTEFSYDAELAGLEYNLTNTTQGLYLAFGGYNEKMAVLIKAVLEKLVDFTIDDERFAHVHDVVARKYANFKLDQPYQHAMYENDVAVEVGRWHMDEYCELVGGITADDVRAFASALMRTTSVEMLIFGNMAAADALGLADSIKEQLTSVAGHAAPLESQHMRPRAVQVPLGVNVLRKDEPNEENENSAVDALWQIGVQNDRDIALLDMLARASSKPAFQQLRTTEQLGYIVWSGASAKNGVQSYRVLVQSSVKSPSHVESRILAFVDTIQQILDEMTEEEFAALITTEIAVQLEKPKTIREELSRHWRQIDDETYQFKRKENVVAELKKLSKADLVAFYQQYIVGSGRRVLVSRIYGKGHQADAEDAERLDARVFLANRLSLRRTAPILSVET